MEIIKKCNCFEQIAGLNLSGIEDCSDPKQLACFISGVKNFYAGNILMTCQQCPTDCNKLSFPLTTSFSSYPSRAYAEFLYRNSVLKKLVQNFSFAEIESSVVAFDVYFKELMYTNITQVSKMDGLGLLSSIGGFLGLLLGASLLTFVEVIEAFLTVLLHLLTSKSQKVF